MKVNFEPYTLDPDEWNWQELLEGWKSILPSKFDVIMVSRFGDVFIVSEDRSVHMLDSGGGALDPVASSLDEFQAQFSMRVREWLLMALVDESRNQMNSVS